jgi:hypothetical protein
MLLAVQQGVIKVVSVVVLARVGFAQLLAARLYSAIAASRFEPAA